MRIIAFDYGTKKIGVALSDPLGVLCYPHGVFRYQNKETLTQTLDDLFAKYPPGLVLIGLPKGLYGQTGTHEKAAQDFATFVHNRYKIPTQMHDERFTSEQAKQELWNMGYKEKEMKDKLDAMAAYMMLREYMGQI